MSQAKDKTKVVIVGNGMVGHHFVEQLVQQNGDAEITVLSAEPRLAYDRVHLSEYFSGKSADDLALTTPEKYEQMNVQFKTECTRNADRQGVIKLSLCRKRRVIQLRQVSVSNRILPLSFHLFPGMIRNIAWFIEPLKIWNSSSLQQKQVKWASL